MCTSCRDCAQVHTTGQVNAASTSHQEGQKKTRNKARQARCTSHSSCLSDAFQTCAETRALTCSQTNNNSKQKKSSEHCRLSTPEVSRRRFRPVLVVVAPRLPTRFNRQQGQESVSFTWKVLQKIRCAICNCGDRLTVLLGIWDLTVRVGAARQPPSKVPDCRGVRVLHVHVQRSSPPFYVVFPGTPTFVKPCPSDATVTIWMLPVFTTSCSDTFAFSSSNGRLDRSSLACAPVLLLLTILSVPRL